MTSCICFAETTPLFAKTLKSVNGADPDSAARDLLRTTLLKMREKAHFLVSFIPGDIPGLTAHDVSHLDALWDMAAKIAGDSYDLTPAEAFVLGGAILLHDAALSVASYPDGLAGVKATVEWGDVAAPLARDGVAEADIEKQALPKVLRQRHAAQAEIIATTPFKRKADGPEEYLIDDGELRQFYGRIIGKIAHSHWQPVSALEKTLGKKLTPARRLPKGWTVDPVKLACLLRVADAAHLSASRAPSFLMALTKPTGVSATHWTFQNKLGEPEVEHDKLIYSSGSDVFGLDDADAWWLCFDSLSMVQEELRAVDILLADTERPRFQAREVAGVGAPSRLKEHVLVEGWEPVDARVTISDVPTLVRTLGGAQLYGDDNSVPLRELMQNACDAVRARRLQQNKDEKWGTITVRLIEDRPEGVWLEVLDDGVGMTERVLTGPLLDFGKSFWRSGLANEEFPGMAKKFADAGKEQTGRFGIGFYSVFMLGDHVTVTSRPYRGAESETKTLDFRTGLSSRPLLRNPTDDERLDEPGTRVRVLLHKKPFDEGGLWWKFKQYVFKDGDWFPKPERILAFMAPAIDANLDFISLNGKVRCIDANDWLILNGKDLHSRITMKESESFSNYINNTSNILDNDNNIVARVSLIYNEFCCSLITNGGFYYSKLYFSSGILPSNILNVARNDVEVVLNHHQVFNWLSEQSVNISKNCAEDIDIGLVEFIAECGVRINCIPFIYNDGNLISLDQFRHIANQFDEIFLYNKAIDRTHFDFGYNSTGKMKLNLDLYKFKKNVFIFNYQLRQMNKNINSIINLCEYTFMKYDPIRTFKKNCQKFNIHDLLENELKFCWENNKSLHGIRTISESGEKIIKRRVLIYKRIK